MKAGKSKRLTERKGERERRERERRGEKVCVLGRGRERDY
jgi:hypothetical protein